MSKKLQTSSGNNTGLFIPSAPMAITAFIDHPGHDGEIAPGDTPAPEPCPLDEDRYGSFWPEYQPSLASRRPSAKSTTNFRAYGIDQDRREIFSESLEEFSAIQMGMADRNVERVEVQVGPVFYFDEDGVERRTTLDIVVHMRNGEKYAVAIKPEGLREKSGIDDVVAAVKRDNPDFADDVFVRTDADISEAAIHNARLVLRSARICNATHVSGLAMVAGRIAGRISIGELLDLYRNDGVGFAAAVLLVQEGALEPAEPGRLTRRTMVRWTGGATPDAIVLLAPDPNDALRALVMTNHL